MQYAGGDGNRGRGRGRGSRKWGKAVSHGVKAERGTNRKQKEPRRAQDPEERRQDIYLANTRTQEVGTDLVEQSWMAP